MANLFKTLNSLQLLRNCLKQSVEVTGICHRGIAKTHNPNPPPRKRHPPWLPKVRRVLYEENITSGNKEFIQEVIQDKYTNTLNSDSPLKVGAVEPQTEWTEKSRRTGVIAKKIGVYPMWMKNGKKVATTLLQVLDNHVIKYIPPEEWKPVIGPKKPQVKRKLGCLLVGADSLDPQLFTKEYSSLYSDAGVMPKRVLSRFVVSPDAALQPGTPLYAAHFRPGEIVDIRGKTMDRGFQGVMKRWGFKGMPASHGVTKTHRRGGNIGSGGEKARVMPGTKMPGHMGNRWRVFRGIKILRVNTKHNVIWVLGQSLPGEVGSFCYIYDTIMPQRKSETPPHFPTYLPKPEDAELPEDLFVEELHTFREPTIEYNVEKQ